MVKAEAVFLQAVTSADASVLANILDSEFTCTSASGSVLTKAQTLAQLPKMAIAPSGQAAWEVRSYGALGDVQGDR